MNQTVEAMKRREFSRGGEPMTIAELLLAEASSESERICVKQKLFKLTGSCEA